MKRPQNDEQALKDFLEGVRHPNQLSVSSLIQRFRVDAKTAEYHLTLAINRSAGQ